MKINKSTKSTIIRVALTVCLLAGCLTGCDKPQEEKSPFALGYVYTQLLLAKGTRQPQRSELEVAAREMYTWRLPRERGYREAEFPEFYRGVLKAYDDKHNRY